MIKLGTHNSMTYLTPIGALQVLAWPTGKCQDLTIEEQYEFGVRLFDLRIRFEDKDTPYFAHGFLEFRKKKVTDVLDFLNGKRDCVVNLVMESFGKVQDTQDAFFVDFCKMSEATYKEITFIGGWSKFPASGHSLYTFAPKERIQKNEVYKVFTLLNQGIQEGKSEIQNPSGNGKDVLKKIVDGGVELLKSPAFFAQQNNPEYWKNVNEDSYTMMDFVQIGASDDYLSKLPASLQERIRQLAKTRPKFE